MPDNRPIVIPHASKDLLAEAGGSRIALALAEAQAATGTTHVCLTGGSMGVAVWKALASSSLRELVDWSAVHFWWSDERFLPSGDSERNAQQVAEAFFDHVAVPAENIHVMGDSDRFASPDAAAAAYAEELKRHADPGQDAPRMALSLLGMGPDGHMASLFPGRPEILDDAAAIIPIEGSPKPPPQRVTMTRPLINQAERIWFLVSGEDKAEAFSRLVSAADASPTGPVDADVLSATPAAGGRGTRETLYLVTRDAHTA